MAGQMHLIALSSFWGVVHTAFEKYFYFLIDIIFFPFTVISLLFLKFLRSFGIRHLVLSRFVSDKIKVYPIIDHYYEPFFDKSKLHKALDKERILPGIDFNIKEQLLLLEKFNYNEELMRFPIFKKSSLEFSYEGGSFPRGDSEYYYSVIRYFKPRKIIEIGSGKSTLMALNAVKKNKLIDNDYYCEIVCVEPYEQKWLNKLEIIKLVRRKVEHVDYSLFTSPQKNDILFIDSSHIIRPQGDVLFEYLEVLPRLNSGVLVHIHDIFTPRDYPEEWIIKSKIFWNEQYLLEAFLTNNDQFKVIGSLNYLGNNFPELLLSKTPVLKAYLNNEPVNYSIGSFWIEVCPKVTGKS